MAKIDLERIPRFSELPVKSDAPPESAWGVFGDHDDIGCLNFLTPQGVVAAARLVKSGRVFRLDAPINYAEPPLFDRTPAKHTITSLEPYGVLGHDDSLDNFNTQLGSQWDGLAHMGHVRYRAFYNGVKAEQIKSGPDGRLGIHNWGGLVARGVLIDAFEYRNRIGRPVNPLNDDRYTLADLQGALGAERVELRPGTILLVRTGWMQAYLKASAEQKQAMGSMAQLRCCGIDASREVVAWFWDNRLAAVGTDCPAFEAWPFDPATEGALHYRTLALLGLPIGEQFDLEALAQDCAKDGRYEFMLVSVPLNLEGGVASPPNAVAIK